MAWLSIFPRTEKFYLPLDLGLDTEPGMNFPVDFSVEFVSPIIAQSFQRMKLNVFEKLYEKLL